MQGGRRRRVSNQEGREVAFAAPEETGLTVVSASSLRA
jgi:hypothetical protein